MGFPAVTTQSEPFISIRIVHSIISMDPSFTIFFKLDFFFFFSPRHPTVVLFFFFFFTFHQLYGGTCKKQERVKEKKGVISFFVCVTGQKEALC